MRLPFALAFLELVGCEGGQSPPPTDGDRPGDGGNCVASQLVEGELIDWDSTDADFLGIADATITLVGDPSRTITTPPNGRVSICGRSDQPLSFVVDGPGDYLDGTLDIDRDAVGSKLGLRGITSARAFEFFSENGLVLNPNFAQIVVAQTGDRLSMSIDATHDTVLAANDDDGDGELTWTAGTAGRFVLFPNVEVATSSVNLTMSPDTPRVVPIASGQLSLVATFFVLVGP